MTTLILAGTSAWFYDRAMALSLGELQERLRALAAIAALAVDGDAHDRVQTADQPEYAAIKHILAEQRAASADIRDVYTMRPGPAAQWTFVVDAEDAGGEIYSAPGTPYDATQDPVLVSALDRPAASAAVYTDEYGAWLSGYAPIRADDGRVVGVIGVDVSAANFAAHQRELALRSFLVFLVGVTVALATSMALSRQIADPIEVEAALEAASRRELLASRDRAVELAQLKSALLSTVSHEIRTPMTGIVGMADHLLSVPLPPAERNAAVVLAGAAHSLLAILNDVLDLSKMEAGKLEIDDVPCEPAAIVAQTVALFQANATVAGLALSSEVGPGVPAWVRGDPARLQQVLVNLVANALKFTPRGSVVVTVGVEGGALRFAVADTGIGVAPEARERVFEPFAQADGSTARRYGGTGLGLAICRELVGLMGGTIGVRSEVSTGSTFWFTLPLRLAEAPAAPAPPPTPAPMAERARVLLAEDTELVRAVVEAQLRALGLDVVCVADGAAAVTAAATGAFAMIFLDCHMPNLDGYAAARAIRQAAPSGGRRVPIVALSADAQPGTRQACLDAGMDDYLAKPFSQAALRERVTRWLAAPRLPPGERPG